MRESETELKKRYEIEKIYLRSQVNAVQLYARWMKPYLNAAKALEQRTSGGASIVTNFSTTMFELTVLAEGDYKPEEDVAKGDLPEMFLDKKKNERKYVPIIIVEFKFRTIPGKIQGQNYSFRGKVEVTFTSYSLNKDELKVLKEQMVKSDIGDLSTYIEGATSKSLEVLQSEINDYLDDKPKEEKKDEKKNSEDINPFSALFSIFSPSFWGVEKKKDEKKKDTDLSKGVPKDNEFEKIIRSQAIFKARGDCSRFYGEFKRAQGMVA
jgi:hypothetical protein